MGNILRDMENLTIAIEMRRRVKEQLKRIGGMEFWDTNFSYIDKESQEETFVSCPEERGSNLIEDVPLTPGTCYTATCNGDNVALAKVEVITMNGNGKLTITGTSSQEVKENIKNTHITIFVPTKKETLLSTKHSLAHFDVTVQISTILGSTITGGIGSAVFVAIISSIFR